MTVTEPMTPTPEIPREAVEVHYNDCGILPSVGLHRRDRLYRQESSYSHCWLSAAMLIASVVVALFPWHTQASASGELKYYIAGGLVWGCICSIIPYFIRNACGQTITIDPKNRTLCITSNDFSGKLSWQKIIGLQICRREADDYPNLMNGYQLNLVWQDSDGAVRRHCLLQHSARGFAVRLGRRYESLFAFPLIDHTRKGQPSGAAYRSQPINSTSSAAGSGR